MHAFRLSQAATGYLWREFSTISSNGEFRASIPWWVLGINQSTSLVALGLALSE